MVKKIGAGILVALWMISMVACKGKAEEATGAKTTEAAEATGEETKPYGETGKKGAEPHTVVAEETPEAQNETKKEVILSGQTEKETVIRLGGLKGPTSMGMVKLLEDAEKGTAKSEIAFTMAVSGDELAPMLLKGELDVAAVPANLAAVLYNNSEGAVQFVAVNTLGVLYIVETGEEEIKSISDLEGRTIYATGKGTTPEYTLRYLLLENGLDPDTDVSIEWMSEPTETVAKMATEDHAIAMMPEPFVTVAGGQLETFRVALDLTEEWEKLDNESPLITAGLLVRKGFAEEHPEALRVFLEEYKASADYLNEHPKEGAVLVEKYGIVKTAVAEKAIPGCNVTYLDGEEMKTAVGRYLQVLYDANPKAVGGKLPDDGFYRTEP